MDEPLDLSKKSASSTKETFHSLEKQHCAEKKDIRVLCEKSSVTLVAEFSSPEENSWCTSENECKKPFHTHKLNEIKEMQDSQDMISDEHVNFKRKKSENLSTNSEAKIRRCSNYASSRNFEDKSRLSADSDCNETASADYYSCRPLLSTSASCSYDSTAIQKPPTSNNRVSRFICEQCGSCFRDNYELQRHTRTHTGEKPFECVHCEKKFTRKENLEKHIIRKHTKKPSYLYEVCEKSFVTNRELELHIKSHTGEMNFPFNECKKSFTTKGRLTQHSRAHTGVNHYVCQTCNKAYTTKTYLKFHENTHKDKPKEI